MKITPSGIRQSWAIALYAHGIWSETLDPHEQQLSVEERKVHVLHFHSCVCDAYVEFGNRLNTSMHLLDTDIRSRVYEAFNMCNEHREKIIACKDDDVSLSSILFFRDITLKMTACTEMAEGFKEQLERLLN